MTLFFKEVELVWDKEHELWRHPDGYLLTSEGVMEDYYTQEGAFCESCVKFIDFTIQDVDNYISNDDGTFICKKCLDGLGLGYINGV